MLVPYMGVVAGSIWEILAKDAVQAFEMSMCNMQWKDHFKGSRERELSTHTHTFNESLLPTGQHSRNKKIIPQAQIEARGLKDPCRYENLKTMVVLTTRVNIRKGQGSLRVH